MARQMKDSGIEWIGMIPAEWEQRRLKYILCERNEKNDPIKTREILSLTAIQGVIPHAEKEGGGNKPKEDVSAYKLAYPNDIVMNSMNVLSGAVGLSKYYGCVSPVYYMLYSDDENIDIRFYNYVFKTKAFQRSLMGLGNGILIKETESGSLNTIRMRIPMEKLNGLYLFVPDYLEQIRIVEFLEKRIPEIDAVISKTKESIKEYKKYKQAVISEAVRIGLDNTVPMKESGIKGIGVVNEKYSVLRLKYLFGYGDDGLKVGPFGSAMKGKTLENGEYKIYNQAHLISGDFSFDRHYISEDSFNELISYEVKSGDVLFSMMGTIGKCKIMPEGFPKGIMDSHLLKARLNNKVMPKYFEYVYDKDNSDIIIAQMLEVANGSIMTGLNSTIVKNLFMPVPSLSEQEEIVEYLDAKCAEIDALIEMKKRFAEEMEAYKKSLIYEYVTGKKEVL